MSLSIVTVLVRNLITVPAACLAWKPGFGTLIRAFTRAGSGCLLVLVNEAAG